jgi:hypothetical protein
MPRRQEGSQLTWKDVKVQLSSFDRLGLLGLIQDLYVAHKDNQTFPHTRFGLGKDILKPYKETLDRWLWPDVLRNQDTSVVKARQAISSFKKAVGDLAGLAELMMFYCECAAGFCNDVGYQDEAYFDALVRMFEQALKTIAQLSGSDRNALIARLDRVRVPATTSAMASATTWIPCLPGTGEPDAIRLVAHHHPMRKLTESSHRAAGSAHLRFAVHDDAEGCGHENDVGDLHGRHLATEDAVGLAVSVDAAGNRERKAATAGALHTARP